MLQVDISQCSTTAGTQSTHTRCTTFRQHRAFIAAAQLQKSPAVSANKRFYKKMKRATSLRLITPSTRIVSGCTTMTRRTLGIERRSRTRRSWSCRVHTYSRVRLLAMRGCDAAQRARHVSDSAFAHHCVRMVMRLISQAGKSDAQPKRAKLRSSSQT